MIVIFVFDEDCSRLQASWIAKWEAYFFVVVSLHEAETILSFFFLFKEVIMQCRAAFLYI